MAIQVLLADDHVIVRQGLKGLLEREGFKVCGEATDGREAVRVAEVSHPDVAVLDLSMPGLNGIDAAREIMSLLPQTKTILLTMYSEDSYILQALSAGANGYVLKTQAWADLVQAIREVARGSFYLSPGVSRAVVDAYRARTSVPPDPLSPRERQILQLVAEGKTTKQIAEILGVSVKTAESHRSRLMAKLDIHEIAGLVRYAIRRGMIQP
jgi:DNA-binding NarL/FixJ family response regulator